MNQQLGILDNKRKLDLVIVHWIWRSLDWNFTLIYWINWKI